MLFNKIFDRHMQFDIDEHIDCKFRTSVRVGHETVRLRFFAHGNGLKSLERQLCQRDGVALIQVLPFYSDSGVLSEFASADPYVDILRSQYDAIFAECRRGVFKSESEDWRYINGSTKSIVDISACLNESELWYLSKSIVEELGGRGFLFQWLRLEEKSGDILDYRYLVGCHPGWVHKYIHRVWYMNDPFLEYAKLRISPMSKSRIEDSGSGGDSNWSAKYTVEYGFRHIALFPVHVRSGWVGVLLVTGSHKDTVSAMVSGPGRGVLRQLAAELLDWRINRIRESAATRFNLDEREICALRISRAGGTAENIAVSLGLSLKGTYKLFERINSKLGTSHIAKAVVLTEESGLLD
jgi:DNA-binding CsgD family transcriptional regulator